MSDSNIDSEEMKNSNEKFSSELSKMSISATKMNVLYMGVDNPIEVSSNGIKLENIQVSVRGYGGTTIKDGLNGSYIVNVNRPTRMGEFTTLDVSANGFSESKDFRVKRIPNPVAKLSGKNGGIFSSGEFKAQAGISAIVENFDFDVRCNVLEYNVVHIQTGQQAGIVLNRGGKFSTDSSSLIGKAQSGDRFYFENIKCKCPGDIAGRIIGSMAFKIR